MKNSAWKLTALFLSVILFAAACSMQSNATQNSPTPVPPQASPGALVPTIISVPDAAEAVRNYLSAWSAFDYNRMYEMLTTLSRDSISLEQFDQRYRHVTDEAVLVGIDYEILQVLTNPTSAQVGYRVIFHSSVVGDFETKTQMNLSLESGAWHVVWDDTIILPELAGGNTLSLEITWPTRGIIYDHNGATLAADSRAVAVSVVPSAITKEQKEFLPGLLQKISGIYSTYFSARLFAEDAPYVIPLFEVPQSRFEEYQNAIADYYNAIGATSYYTHLSFIGAAGAHSVGWVGPIPLEETDEWMNKGYPVDAQIGRSGAEAWAEEYLAGRPSADLYVVTPEKLLLTRLAFKETQPSQSVYTTLDADLQWWAHWSLQGLTGAIVVLERDSGRILAIASTPTYDPNSADLYNPNSLWDTYFPDTQGLFFNRATQGQYQPGSIFKVITMSAALESEMFTPNDVLECGYYWYGPDNSEFYDWTLSKGRPASGNLTLVQGLMRSCNIWFYDIGYRLYQNNFATAVADMARGFGLGQTTGQEYFPEEKGNITNPDDNATAQPWFNAVQQAIGQSDTLITPIQAAVYTAALGNGGTLYRPQMIEKVVNTAGESTYQFEPVVNGTLPISESTLQAVREGMLLVTQNSRGTAYYTFVNRAIKVYGKTGTAQNPGIDAHAWFIGFTDEQDPNKPDIAMAILVENQGDGSQFSAPIFRRLMEVYFYGQPQSTLPWENGIMRIDPKYFMTPEELEALENENNN